MLHLNNLKGEFGLRVSGITAGLFACGAGFALAEAPNNDRALTQSDCPPDIRSDGPTVGRSDETKSLSDKLAELEGRHLSAAGR